ncbi:hypothetical protein [Saccharicrinis sp. FJH54]|uniref:hypothetical protein n=1 Tax=Saccharicrinis sp. FJH54 TaxID=3344665 RepID=UPI0035D52471
MDFKAMTPMGTELELKGHLKKMEGRKVWVDMTLSANGEICATAEMLAIRLKE